MAYTTINKSSDHFNTLTYTGTGSSGTKTGVGFQSDWTWIKARGNTTWHYLYDAVRGAGIEKEIFSNSNDQEGAGDAAAYGYLSAFTSDGFSTVMGSNTGSDGLNKSGTDFVAWNWKAGGGQGSSNTDGSINTTYTSVNTTAGFSISQYEGTGSNATFGHGLGVAPQMVIVKNIDATQNWFVYHQGIGATKVIYLDLANAEQTLSQGWNNTAPTSSVVSIGTEAGVNQSGSTHIAYCFAEKKGYSKFGNYTGNGNVDSPFIYTGFKPAWIMIKKTSSGTGRGWFIFDNKRIGYNPKNYVLEANDTAADGTNDRIDLLSNGFKLRTTDLILNESGINYIYMAFAEEPLVANVGSNGIPATAR